MKTKFLKIIAFFVSVFLALLLVKNNVAVSKDVQKQEKKGKTVTTLNINSELVKKLSDMLNLDLINNNCSDLNDCLINSNYNFYYYKNTEFTDNFKIYLSINSLYRNKVINPISMEDKTMYSIEKDTLEKKVEEIFGSTDFSSFDSSFNPSPECGIINYIYTGHTYDIDTNLCKNSGDIAVSKITKAYKIEDYVILNIKAFHYVDQDYISIKNFNDEVIFELSKDEYNEDDVFKKDNVDEYEFRFKLNGDKYFLSSVNHI